MVGANSKKPKSRGSDPPLWSENSNHKGKQIQLWSIQVMKQALQYYFTINLATYDDSRMEYKAIANLYGLPHETFHRWTMGELKGYCGHLSGGKNMLKVLTPDWRKWAGFPHWEVCTSRFPIHLFWNTYACIRVCWHKWYTWLQFYEQTSRA